MTTATFPQSGTLLQQREIYLSILKDLTIMDDIFMRNVLKDSACTEYILFQNADNKASLKRARYHGSLVDANTLKAGQDPVDLPDTYIIFITANDTLGFNLPIYHINRIIDETNQHCSDQLHIIYINSSFQDDTVLGRLMYDLHCPDPHDMYSEILARRVTELKETQEGVDIMCEKLNELIEAERNEGEKRGVLIGEAQGVLNTKKETAKNLRHMGMALTQIAQALNVSVQMIQEWVAADCPPIN